MTDKTDEKKIAARRDQALLKALSTPHKPHKPLNKVKKTKAKRVKTAK